MAKHVVLAIVLAGCATPRATSRPVVVQVAPRPHASASRSDVPDAPMPPLAEVVETGYPDPCATNHRKPIDDTPTSPYPTPLTLLDEPCKRTVFPAF